MLKSEGPRYSRRDLLRLGGGAVAGSAAAYLLSACGSAADASVERTSTAGRLAAASHVGVAKVAPPKLVSRPTVSSGPVQSYRSRPDLSPATITVNTYKPGQAPGLIFMDSHNGVGQQGPMILDQTGQLVWFEPLSANRSPAKRAFNVLVQTYRGRPVLTWFEGAVVNGHGVGEYVIADTSYREITRVRAANGYQGDLHEFLITPQGTAFLTCYGTARADLRRFGGPANGAYYYGVAQELDLKTGKVLFEWRSDEHVPLEESYAPIIQKDAVPWDYFHINSVSPDTDGNVLVSSRCTYTVYKIDRRTGKEIWRMGGKQSDFSFGPGAHFSWQHDSRRQADGTITIFDNGAGFFRTEPQSRGLVLNLDLRSKRVNLVRQYLHPGGPVSAAALGSVQVLPNGHVFMGWAVNAGFSEFGPDGEVLLDGQLTAPCESYRAFRQAWHAQPATPPAVVARRSGAAMTVYASWNGATEVGSWLVLGGAHPGSLSPLGTAPKAGFESQIQVPSASAYVAVQALSSKGQVLGRSAAVSVS